MTTVIDDLGIQFGILDDALITLWEDDAGVFLGGTDSGISIAFLAGSSSLRAQAKQRLKASARLSAAGSLSCRTNDIFLFANPLNTYRLTINNPLLALNVSSVLFSRTLDNGLRSLADESDKILICSAHPITYAQAVSFSLGEKDFGVPGGAFGPITAGVNGRKVASTAIVNGSLTVAGIGTYWAAVDSASSRLLATGQFDAPRTTFAGVPFSLPSFEVTLTGAD